MNERVSTSGSDIVWIDVRTAQEHQARHIPGHINISHEFIEDGIKALNLSVSQPIRLYCRTGRRSGIAAEVLKNMGFLDVENAGSIDAVMDEL